MDKENIEKREWSFQKGWGQVQNRDSKAVKAQIMRALNLKTRVGWGDRMWGRIEPRISEVAKIEEIFAEYDIQDVWGKTK
jgi:hypothetical protein